MHACNSEPVGTNGSDAARKGRLLMMPSGRAAQATVPKRRGSSAMEGVLVQRKRPSLTRRLPRRAWRHGGAVLRLSSWQHAGGATDGDGGSRHRASEVTSRARFAADKAAAGRRSAEELPIAAPPGPRGALFLTSDRGSGSGHASGLGRGRWLKLEGRRQATLHPKVRWRSQDRRRAGEGFARHPTWAGVRKDEGSGRVVREGASPGGRSRKGLPRSRHVRESDGPCWVHVVVSRLQKSERSIFLRGGSASGETRKRLGKCASASRQAGQARG